MAVIPSWQLILTDLAGTVLGEITGATERQIVIPHLRLPQLTFKIPVWHPLAKTVMDTETLVQAWRTDRLGTKRLVFNGPVQGVNEQVDNVTQTIAATAAGPYVRLGYRVIGTSKAGIQFPTSGVADLGQIARDILTTTNGQEYTGISNGTLVASQTAATGVWHLKNVAEAIAELTTGLNSFEFEVKPTVPTDVAGVGGWPKIGELNIAPLIGNVTRSDAIFEFGTGRANVASYERAVSRTGLLTRGYIAVSGWEVSTTDDLISYEDTPARTARGLWEAVVPDAGITDAGLRARIVQFHVAIRKQPRQLITFKPATNAVPSPLTDFEIGDYVRGRSVIRGATQFDATFRVWGVTFTLDPNGNESVELELVMP